MSDYKLVPVEPTPEMVEAAEDAYMPFGDMEMAIRMSLLAAPDHIADARKKVSRPQIREVFLRNGFTIKPGCDDLREYVYKAAFELMELAAPAVQGEPVAWMTHHDEPMLFLDEKDAAAYCDDDESPIPLYTAPQPAEQQPLPCQECGGDGAGGEHEDDCAMAQPAEQQPAPDVAGLVEALDKVRGTE